MPISPRETQPYQRIYGISSMSYADGVSPQAIMLFSGRSSSSPLVSGDSNSKLISSSRQWL